MTPTSTSSAPLIDAELFYNILMEVIEPELCTDMLPILDDLYLDETDDQRAVRMQRYISAIERFKQRAAEFSHDFQGVISQMGEDAMKIAKEDQEQQDIMQLQATEDSIGQS